ncbi:hypothetical protein BX616_010407 [Lobosporangium transversale]|nr:hypothetical protein BX616_010407 [Lobosporangium transversale]
MVATRFSVMHGVKTYAIGGITNRPLSYFTFPGGFVMDSGTLLMDIKDLKLKGVKNMPVSSPVVAETSMAVGEIYTFENSTIPLEYDAQYYAANIHLDQDPVSARHPDQVWVKIATQFKK